MAQDQVRIEGLNQLIHQIENMVGEITNEEVMGEIGTYVVTQILLRTGEGKDVDGRSFAPYSPKYKLFRRKMGRPHDIVNLQFFGSMLSALTYEAFADKVEIFFQPTTGKAPSGKPSSVTNAEKAYFLNENREFFGINDDDVFRILSIIQDHLRKLFEE